MQVMKPGNKTFSIITFGCKLNQYESECIRESLESKDWTYREFDEGADYFIINSCTVTGKSDSRCRNAVRRARRSMPEAKIIVTGCYAETQADRLEKMDEVDIVIGNEEKGSIPSLLDRMEGNVEGKDDHCAETMIKEFRGHSRAFIKVQDGCNASCAYCIVPVARGKSRSVPPELIRGQILKLVESGYSEVVLTGIHIGRYGYDLKGRLDLAGLIESILLDIDLVRIRLSSIEINEVSDALLELIASTDRIAPHLHIPLQSGDDDILKAMGRPYDTESFANRIDRISKTAKNFGLGTDCIVGFPGETDEQFKHTYEFVKRMPFTYLHVFNYSKRPGTIAAKMPNQVPPEKRKSRSKRLIRLGKKKRTAFMKSLIGRVENALVQGPANQYSRFSLALTGSYAEVYIKRDEELSGRLLPVMISHYSRGRLYGTPCGPARSAPGGGATL
jgi:threonylcarbamoyladenosine tRNA methylthiotransferase MtaB